MAGIVYYKNGVYFTTLDGPYEAYEELVQELSLEGELTYDDDQELAFIDGEQLEYNYLDEFCHIATLS